MSFDFSNRKVLVTGGSRGIGAAIVLAFLKNNATVTYTGQSLTASQKIEGAHYLQLDLANDESIQNFLNSSANQTYDILINNAGINKIDHFHEIDLDDFKLIQKVNLEGPFRITQHVIKGMIQRKYGRIINVASIFSNVSKEKRASYSSSKFGLVGLTKAIAIEYAEQNILANVVSPGFIDTQLTRQILSESQIDQLTSLVPAKRLGLPTEIADVVLFLSSEQNSFMTGQNITADGGFTSV